MPNSASAAGAGRGAGAGAGAGAGGAGEGDGGEVAPEYTFTFYEDIQPILQRRCSLCHPGATPDDWTDYQQVLAKAQTVATRVENGSMPIANATQMTDEEREMVIIWVSEGAPSGEEE